MTTPPVMPAGVPREPLVSRFAPAPTGFLHLGHVVNALYVWGVTKAMGGRVLLRIEDHDRQRCRPEFERAILDDLDWLGFEPDDYVTAAFRAGPCAGRQNDRAAIYASALGVLEAAGIVYACRCSRGDIETASPDRQTGGTEPAYPGRCRDARLARVPGCGIRVQIFEGVERFHDLRHGVQTERPASHCGDVLIRNRRGDWTYQFAVAVDDWDQGVTLVIRGDDLLASTGRQLQIARHLGRSRAPVFLHHPLLMKTRAQKLSKSDEATAIRDLRAAGLPREAVIGRAAAAAGLAHRANETDRATPDGDARPLSVAEACDLVRCAGNWTYPEERL